MRVLAVVALGTACSIGGAQAPKKDILVLVLHATASCRMDLDSAATPRHVFQLGDTVHYVDAPTSHGGHAWLRDTWWGGCWIDSAATIPLDAARPGHMVAVIADSVLAESDTSFERVVRMLNYLETKSTYGTASQSQTLAEHYPELAGLRLRLMDKATTMLLEPGVKDTPLATLWINAHRRELFFYEPDAGWRVPASAYWKLVDAHRGAPWVESLAFAAGYKSPGADECFADCRMDLVLYGPAEYWRRFPNGPHIREMIVQAEEFMQYTVPGPGAERDELPTRSMIARVRASLSGVSAANKRKLLATLTELEKHTVVR